MENDIIKTEVYHKGAIKVNHCIKIKQCGDIIVAAMDMDSKYVEISARGGGGGLEPEIFLGANENTLSINKELKDELTAVKFTDLKGWDIYCAETSKYTVRICFTKQ